MWLWRPVVAAASTLLIVTVCSLPAQAQNPPGEHPNLQPRITQDMVENDLSWFQIRQNGMRIFSTPFNLLDGFGENHEPPYNRRPALQTKYGHFLRMNGLDSQTCLECHSILSNATIPATFAVAGVGGVAASAFPNVLDPDIDDSENNGYARIGGRFINPPFSFGSGGVELLGKEMTFDLQELKQKAKENPGVVIPLVTKGVSFGTIVYSHGQFDLSNVMGVGEDLVIKPFGRKGDNAFSVRQFDIGALQFHQGMQPVEVVGQDVDDDGDGVANEILEGELSSLHIYQVSIARPRQAFASADDERDADEAMSIMAGLGCTQCHVPFMTTNSRFLPIAYPENPVNPYEHVFFQVDLSSNPEPGFQRFGRGVIVPLFADLKMHDMGDELAESTGSPIDRFFTTARLWGVADTAPYLHDGRATTLTEAILAHGGEAKDARDAFANLSDLGKRIVLAFLRTLRVPAHPNADLQVSVGPTP